MAITDAETFARAAQDPVVGLLFFASYPATNLVQVKVSVLSISGSNEGLSTPAKIAAAKPTLPVGTRYFEVAGGIHAFFGDYGPQDEDGKPAISHEQARAEIAVRCVEFVNGLGGQSIPPTMSGTGSEWLAANSRRTGFTGFLPSTGLGPVLGVEPVRFHAGRIYSRAKAGPL